MDGSDASQATTRQICVQRREEKLGSKCWSSSFLFYCSEVLRQFEMTTRSEWEKKKAKAADELYLISPLSSSYGSCQDERGVYSLAFSLSGSRVVGLQQAHSILSTTICLWFHHTINKGTTVVCVSIQGSPEKRQWGRASWDYCRRRL